MEGEKSWKSVNSFSFVRLEMHREAPHKDKKAQGWRDVILSKVKVGMTKSKWLMEFPPFQQEWFVSNYLFISVDHTTSDHQGTILKSIKCKKYRISYLLSFPMSCESYLQQVYPESSSVLLSGTYCQKSDPVLGVILCKPNRRHFSHFSATFLSHSASKDLRPAHTVLFSHTVTS